MYIFKTKKASEGARKEHCKGKVTEKNPMKAAITTEQTLQH